MWRRTLLRTAVVLGPVIGVACSSSPISTRAVRGETIIIPIVSDDPQFTVGFETSQSPLTLLSYKDWQFGTTLFRLERYNQDVGCLGTEPYNKDLQPVWVTRAWPDPASPASIQNTLGTINGVGIRGQVLAAINIPAEMCPGLYRWVVSNVAPSDLPGIEGNLFRNLIEPPVTSPVLDNFEIIAASPNSQPNSLLGWWGLLSQDLQPDMKQLIPYHKVAWDVSLPSLRPAAGDIVFRFPAAKIAIKTVFEDRNSGRGSIVRWCVSGGPAPCPADTNPGDNVGELHVHFVDPDATVWRLSVAFALVNGAATGPLWTADFSGTTPAFGVVSSKLYDRDGNDVTSSFPPVAFAGVW